MNKKKKKLPEKSSKNVKKKSKVSRSLQKTRRKLFPGIPNIRLRLNLKDKTLDAVMCDNLRRMLKLQEDLTESKVQIGYKFNRHKWDLKIRQPRTFKRALATYQEENPDIDIFSEDLRPLGPIIQYVGYIAGVVFGSLSFIYNFLLP